MTQERSIIAGATDYTGYSLDDMMDHLRDWRDNTRDTIERLTQYRKNIEANSKSFERPWIILEFIDHRIDLFQRVLPDLLRLIEELPSGPKLRHVEIVKQLVQRSQFDDHFCVRFKNEYLEEMSHPPILDKVYGMVRDMIMDYLDLANLGQRLRTFVETENTDKKPSLFELKPNFYGLGVDLKLLLKRFWKWIKKM